MSKKKKAEDRIKFEQSITGKLLTATEMIFNNLSQNIRNAVSASSPESSMTPEEVSLLKNPECVETLSSLSSLGAQSEFVPKKKLWTLSSKILIIYFFSYLWVLKLFLCFNEPITFSILDKPHFCFATVAIKTSNNDQIFS